MPPEKFFNYLPDRVSFSSKAAAKIKTIYAPLCGTDALSIKSAISPFLSGDIKIDKLHYLTKPASREDLRQPLREFFIFIKGKGVVSLFQEASGNASCVEMGPLWHKVTRRHKAAGLELTAVNFVPVSGETVELMKVTVKNISKKNILCVPTAAIALFGRALSNKHDHEHVTALLNRPRQVADGVLLETTMAFNEEGHKEAHGVYYVYGAQDKGALTGSFATVDSFYGDTGSLLRPQAVFENYQPVKLENDALNGKEAVGALRFKEMTLKPNESRSFIIAAGTDADQAQSLKTFNRFKTIKNFDQALVANQKFWSAKMASIEFNSGNADFNSWMKWVTLQPVLRRIYGCSFLPDHDYGKGGRGWRDIWQDLLSLILIEPHLVRADLINNCAGIRVDGSNATIIGSRPGEFVADRNAITRIWMDHGAWPLLTLKLYIDQSGDVDILLEKQTYFRDPQLSRTYYKDLNWTPQYGHRLLDKKAKIYEGTILEHLLVQHLTQFFNVGKHNVMRLENADWNDGLDMAFGQGESVAFTSFYAGNLLALADLMEEVAVIKRLDKIQVFKELLILLDTLGPRVNYEDHKAKRARLFEKYFQAVQPVISGEKVELSIQQVAADLRAKGQWIFKHLRRQEKIQVKKGTKTFSWFNGYYDNKGHRVEGKAATFPGKEAVRMTLTGQVFAIMSGMATVEDVPRIVDSVNEFLKDKDLGGYRLNTDFGLRHYLDLGRAFGFAYGTKENGAFFSHMNVMYGAALYQRGFAAAGHQVLQSIYRMAVDGERSKIYPGIPEYFDSEGRGMYHYLTGSASWLVLTQLTQVFGVRGWLGDLILAPQLTPQEFDQQGLASVSCQFAGKRLKVEYHNPRRLDAGSYVIKSININAKLVTFQSLAPAQARIRRSSITKDAVIKVILG